MTQLENASRSPLLKSQKPRMNRRGQNIMKRRSDHSMTWPLDIRRGGGASAGRAMYMMPLLMARSSRARGGASSPGPGETALPDDRRLVIAARARIDRRGRVEEEPDLEEDHDDDDRRDEDDLQRRELGGVLLVVRALAAHAAQPGDMAPDARLVPGGAPV